MSSTADTTGKRFESAHSFWVRVVALFWGLALGIMGTIPSLFLNKPNDPNMIDGAYHGQIWVDAQFVMFLLGIPWDLFGWSLVWRAFCELHFMAPKTRGLYERYADPRGNRLQHWLHHKIRFLMVLILMAMFCSGLGVYAWAMHYKVPAIGNSGVAQSVALFCVFAVGLVLVAPSFEKEKDSIA